MSGGAPALCCRLGGGGEIRGGGAARSVMCLGGLGNGDGGGSAGLTAVRGGAWSSRSPAGQGIQRSAVLSRA